MASTDLDDILALAQSESARHGHFFIGVEHLFFALTKRKGSVTARVLEEHGVTPRFVRYLIRQEMGQGDNRRFWPGFRDTPRLEKVLDLSHDIASRRGLSSPRDRELFLALLEEGDSLPCRILSRMEEVDLAQLAETTTNWSAELHLEHPSVFVKLWQGVRLTDDQVTVLRDMFRGYERVEVEKHLEGGYSSAAVVVACPYHPGGRADAAVVVKLDERQSVLYEKMRYDTFVKDTLPPMTARIVDNPIVPDGLGVGGLKYTFVRSDAASEPVNLADYAQERGPEALDGLLWNLARIFGETWWSQRQPYQFYVWQEYELLLPPALVIEVGEDLPAPRRILRPLEKWSRRGRFVNHEVVALEGFTVQKYYPSRQGILLAAGSGSEAFNRASKIEVRGVEVGSGRFFLGSHVERLIGRVLYTRDELLFRQVEELNPSFDPLRDRLPRHATFPIPLPNPIKRYANLLNRRVMGSLSPIHGDLHLHNILVGPGGNAWLIDFAWSREGHTLFDWAVLEVSLLIEVVAPVIASDSWDDIWPVIRLYFDIGSEEGTPTGGLPVERAMKPIATLREIITYYLADPEDRTEYYAALALCAMRGLGWPTVSLRARRLLYLVAALAMASGRDISSTDAPTDVPDTDQTEFNFRL